MASLCWKEQSADKLTRGMSAKALVMDEIWLKGPSWLLEPNIPYNNLSDPIDTDLELKEEKRKRLHHAGVCETLTQIRETSWIPCGRQTVKSCLKKGLICRRFKVRHGNQITAPLPENRIQVEFQFETVGINCSRPVYTKNDEKAYISLFTCAVTRAIHLEVVSSLSIEHFILAFRRFIARRGICPRVNSDSARTFKSADIDLKKLYMNICELDVHNYFGKKVEKGVSSSVKGANLNKNFNVKTQFNLNDIVLLSEEKVPQQLWRLGKIIEIHKGRDVEEARKLAKENTIKYHEKNKIKYDARLIDSLFEPDNIVIYEEFNYLNRRKLPPVFSGSYEIVQKLSDVNYEITKPNVLTKKPTEIVHASKLRTYYPSEELKLSREGLS
ncbi:uncharacterized protein TNCV_3083151 [Trichonephila clavipes]|nr:uncharacterized protein TNCV_3083151 [Trichonephila clavipes]